MGNTIVYQDVLEYEETLTTNPIDVMQLVLEYEWKLACSIASVDPTSGPIGQTITIGGAGFEAIQGGGGVAINGTAATIVSWSDTEIVATVAAGTTTGNVVVTNDSGEASNPVLFTVTVAELGRARSFVVICG